MAIEQVYGLPGIRAPRTATQKVISRDGVLTYLSQGKLINGSASRDPTNTGDLDVLQAGLLMGLRSSDSQYAPSVLGTLSSGGTIASTSLTVSAATATELNRRVGGSGTFKLTGPNVAGGVVTTETVTYSAVNTTTGVITCTATVNAFINGSFLQPTDGSELPITFIPDGWGIKVTDIDGVTNLTTEFPQIPVAGQIVSSQIVNWPSDAALRQWIVTRVNGQAGGQFVFDFAY